METKQIWLDRQRFVSIYRVKVVSSWNRYFVFDINHIFWMNLFECFTFTRCVCVCYNMFLDDMHSRFSTCIHHKRLLNGCFPHKTFTQQQLRLSLSSTFSLVFCTIYSYINALVLALPSLKLSTSLPLWILSFMLNAQGELKGQRADMHTG